MDPNKLSRQAIDGVRYVQAVLLAVAGVTPLLASYADDISSVANAVVTAVTAVAGLAAVLLELRKRGSTTPVNSPVVPKGTVVDTYTVSP